MSIVGKVLDLSKNKTKRVNLSFNPDLYRQFTEESKKEGTRPGRKMEELMLLYLEEKGKLR